MTETLPYGTWPSPLSAEQLFAGSVTANDLVVDGDDVLWTEGRPADEGRVAVVRWRGGATEDVTPPGWNCRTRVHEYGGAPFTAGGGVVVGAEWDGQRWHRLDQGDPTPVTPEPDQPAGLRFADARILPGGDAMVAVRERHAGDGEPANEIVRVDLADGTTTVLASGRDFVASPRPSPDGTQLVWLAWDHPAMPWDAAELWAGRLDGDGLADARRVTGETGRSVFGPVWLDDDRVAYSREDGDAWRVVVHHLATDATVEPLDVDGEVGRPAWIFGWSVLAPLGPDALVAVVTERAFDRIVQVDLTTDEHAPIDALADIVAVDAVLPRGDGVVVLGDTADGTRTIRTWSPADGPETLAAWPLEGVDAEDIPPVEPVEVPTPDGATTHALVFAPRLHGVTGPDDELPPVVVHVHGGPNGWSTPVATHEAVFWTSRGFAFAMVNYRGSFGYGQRYREALLGHWGELDLIDTMAVARGLADQGLVDGDRMAVRGGSAGGYTTLLVLTEPGHPFACGTSLFGVADLAALAAETHKFESRYLDGVVGPLPEAADVYEERSPINRTDGLEKPLLVLQGLEDEVVPPSQAEAIVAAAAEQGVPHLYVPFEGEQHGFRMLANIVTWHDTELAFYGEVMGFTPAGDLPDLDLDGGR
jgi:dipeptidyl aminopeptidase/acylaminoacyl peptidase